MTAIVGSTDGIPTSVVVFNEPGEAAGFRDSLRGSGGAWRGFDRVDIVVVETADEVTGWIRWEEEQIERDE